MEPLTRVARVWSRIESRMHSTVLQEHKAVYTSITGPPTYQRGPSDIDGGVFLGDVLSVRV
jgi:hypothetical protein